MAANTNTLIEDWIAIWNGDYPLTEQDITEDFVVHAAMMDGGDVLRGRDALVEWIKQLRAATAPAGTKIEFTGIDMLRAEGGKLVEYWVNSDVHVLLAQLGVGA
jgi:hypothetical protein